MANRQVVWEQKNAPIFNTGVDVKVWRDMDQPDLGIAFTLRVDALIVDTSVGSFEGPLQNGPFSVNIPMAGSAIDGTVSDAMFEDATGKPATRIEDVTSLYFVITGSGGIRVPLKHLPFKIPLAISTTTVVVPIPQTAAGSTVPPPPIRIPPRVLIPIDIPPVEVTHPPFNKPPIANPVVSNPTVVKPAVVNPGLREAVNLRPEVANVVAEPGLNTAAPALEIKKP